MCQRSDSNAMLILCMYYTCDDIENKAEFGSDFEMKQIKGLEVISSIELGFGICLTRAVSTMMKSKELSEQVKEATIKMRKEEKNMLEQSAKTLSVVIRPTLKKKESTGELSSG